MCKLDLLQLVAAVGFLAAGGSKDPHKHCAEDNDVRRTMRSGLPYKN